MPITCIFGPTLPHWPGKKFQAKRNHLNKFRRTYTNYEYVPLTSNRIQECLDLEAEWCKVNNCDQHEGTGNERRALIYALHNFDALGPDRRYSSCRW